ncbi:response regulator transcription factor [Pedosphaera parvula]|nr:response regulator transcription factor [Pedosphaera parvula]
MKKIHVLLADDHMVVRQGLRALLTTEEDIEVVGEAETGRQAVEMARQLNPDVVLMDIVMPSLNGLEAARQITKQMPDCKVLILSSYGDDEYVQRLTEVGATGYLIKQTAADDLLKAIRDVERGKTVFSPSIASRFQDTRKDALGKTQTLQLRTEHLTSREAEVLQLIAEGQTNKQIAFELGISAKTVEKHRQQVMNKLKIHDVAGLTRYALSKGIIKANAELKLS